MRRVFIFLLLSVSSFAFGQSCCSGGVPLSNNLGLPATESKVLQMSWSYDLNVLKTLREGTEKIEDDARNRKTHTSILELGYSFTKRFSVDALLPFIRQERTVQNNGQFDFVRSQGIGDAVLLFKYQLLNRKENQTTLHAALGTKLPTGPPNLRDQNGIILNPEMQAGSGTWDGIGWMQLVHSMDVRPSLSVSATASFALKGIYNNYHFGNELQANIGFADRLSIKKMLIDPALIFRYRQTAPDERSEAEIVSTGGQWIFISPSMTFWLRSNLNANINIDLPLYANLQGTQFTPTYRFNIGVYYKLSLKKKEAYEILKID